PFTFSARWRWEASIVNRSAPPAGAKRKQPLNPRMPMIRGLTTALIGVAVLVPNASAGDKDKKGPPDPPGPGIEHKQLADLAGAFDCKVTVFLPDKKTVESTGIMKREMVL